MRRWFLSYNSQDFELAQALEAELARTDPDASIWHCQLKQRWYPPAVGGASVRCREVLGTPIVHYRY